MSLTAWTISPSKKSSHCLETKSWISLQAAHSRKRSISPSSHPDAAQRSASIRRITSTDNTLPFASQRSQLWTAGVYKGSAWRLPEWFCSLSCTAKAARERLSLTLGSPAHPALQLTIATRRPASKDDSDFKHGLKIALAFHSFSSFFFFFPISPVKGITPSFSCSKLLFE